MVNLKKNDSDFKTFMKEGKQFKNSPLQHNSVSTYKFDIDDMIKDGIPKKEIKKNKRNLKKLVKDMKKEGQIPLQIDGTGSQIKYTIELPPEITIK